MEARPERGPRGAISNPVEAALSDYHGLAETVGEWALYGVILLIVVSLAKRIPYGSFLNLHRLFPLGYLARVFHTVVLTRFSHWTTPLGVVLIVLMIGWSCGAVLSLFRRIGA